MAHFNPNYSFDLWIAQLYNNLNQRNDHEATSKH